MTKKTLSILMPALNSRDWRQLAEKISGQIEKFGANAEILVLPDSGESTSGQKRQKLLSMANGEYICSVDDDDDVSDNYVSQIIKGCRSLPDVITFPLQMFFNGQKTEKWQFGLMPDDRASGKMTANHLCAWRADLAREVAWCPDLGYGDDQLWYGPLLASGKAKREHRISGKPLYYYLYNDSVTKNQTNTRKEFSKEYFGSGLKCYWHENDILVEVGNRKRNPGIVAVRDKANYEFNIRESDFVKFHTVRLI